MLHLAAVQPHLRIDDYATVDAFEHRLDALGTLLREARRRTGISTDRCLVVFPEFVGTFLLLADQRIRGASTFDEALRAVALAHPFRLARAVLRWQALTPARAVLLALGRRTRQRYLRAFARFARSHGVYTVAGSVLLPDIDPGGPNDAAPRRGRIYNTSYLFDPSGAVMAGTRKVNLVPDLEGSLGLDRGSPRGIPIVRTEIGRVATLMSSDGFSEPPTEGDSQWRAVAPWVARAGAQVIAQPSANPWPWNGTWVHNAPGESMLRRDQWRLEGLSGQLGALAGVRYAITAHAVGRVLDARFEGRSEILARDAEGTTRVLASARAAEALASSEEVVCAAVDDL